MEERKLLWGDFHKHLQDVERVDEILKEAKRNLDFYPLLCYPFIWLLQKSSGESVELGHPDSLHHAFSEVEKGGALLVESVDHLPQFDEWWQELTRAARDGNEPGDFVTLLGYEWHGDRKRYGDHNVIYFDLEEENPLDPTEKLPSLYRKLQKRKALAIPHHMGYKKGCRGKDWKYWDEELSPVAEVFSSHGSSETDPTDRPLLNNPSMSPGNSETSWRKALENGYRVGAIASNDGPGLPGGWGKGLAAVWAESLSREGIMEALRSRRTYGVTGDRIELKFYLDGAPMGEVLPVRDPENHQARFDVRCPGALDRVELIQNGRRTSCYYHRDRPYPEGEDQYNVKVDFGWGPTPRFGLQEGEFSWEGELRVSEGELTGVQGCFNRMGERADLKDGVAQWKIDLPRRDERDNAEPWSDLKQGVIFKVKGDRRTQLTFSGKVCGERFRLKKSLDELRKGSELFSLEEAAIRLIEEETGVREEEIINRDLYYFNAPKMKIHKAVATNERATCGTFELESLREGRNYAYLRVHQLNGQMAWSSPVWLDL